MSNSTVVVRKYKCTQCDYAASRSDHLKVHIISKHTEGTNFTCDEPGCDFRCKLKQAYNRHKKTAHTINNNNDKKIKRIVPERLQAVMQPTPTNGDKQFKLRRMEPDVKIALTPASLKRIYSKPESEKGQHTIALFNLIAFKDKYLPEKSQMVKHPRYAALCAAMKRLHAVDQETTTDYLVDMCTRNVITIADGTFRPFPLLAELELRTGTKERYNVLLTETKKKEKSKPLPKRIMNVPDFFDAAPLVPPLPPGHARWTRPLYMICDAALAFTHDQLLEMHHDYKSSDGRECLTVFNIVAFAKNYVNVDFQANQVSFGRICRAAEQ